MAMREFVRLGDGTVAFIVVISILIFITSNFACYNAGFSEGQYRASLMRVVP